MATRTVDEVSLITLPDEVAELPHFFTAEERTMVFKELQLAGWVITWKSHRSAYIMRKHQTPYVYTYNFKTDRYEATTLRQIGALLNIGFTV